MGAWGMGITQSDEFCEVYERFMEEYDEGKPLADIKKDILEEQLEEFDEDDGVLHDVYFALGKAEWMCGGISDEILEKISFIINTDANIEFLRDLVVDDKDLKVRRKNLQKFLATISVPRGKTKKRKKSPEQYVPPVTPAPIPRFQSGEIYAYPLESGYRVVAFTIKQKTCGIPSIYCYAWQDVFQEIPSYKELTERRIIPLGWFLTYDLPDVEKFIYIDFQPILKELGVWMPYAFFKIWRPTVWLQIKEAKLREQYPDDLCVEYKEFIDRYENDLKKLGKNNFYTF